MASLRSATSSWLRRIPWRRAESHPAATQVSTRLRLLGWVLVGTALLAALVYAPLAWSAFQDWKLRRMGLPELEALIRREPGNVRARYQLGLAYARGDRYLEASREFLAVLEKDPVRPDVLNDLGASYLVQERYYEALVALRGARAARPNYAEAWSNLGRLHLATQMPYTAVRELEEAVRLDPRDLNAL